MTTAHERARLQVKVLVDATIHAGVLLSSWPNWSALRIESVLCGEASERDFTKAFFQYVDSFYERHNLSTHDLWDLLNQSVIADEYKKRVRGSEKEMNLLITILHCRFGGGDFIDFLRRELATLLVAELSSAKSPTRELYGALIRKITESSDESEADDSRVRAYVAFTKEKLSSLGMRDSLPKSCSLCEIHHVECEQNLIVDLLFLLAAASPRMGWKMYARLYPCFDIQKSVDFLIRNKLYDTIKKQWLNRCGTAAEAKYGKFTIIVYRSLLSEILLQILSEAFPCWYFLRRIGSNEDVRHQALGYFDNLPRNNRDPELVIESQINLLLAQLVAATDDQVFQQMYRRFRKLSDVMSETQENMVWYLSRLRAVDPAILHEFGEGFARYVLYLTWEGPVWELVTSQIEKKFWRRELKTDQESEFSNQILELVDGTVLRLLLPPSQPGSFISKPQLAVVAEKATVKRQKLACSLYTLLTECRKTITHFSIENFARPFLTVFCKRSQEVEMIISTEREYSSIGSLPKTQSEYQIGSRVLIPVPPHNVLMKADILDKQEIGMMTEYVVQWEDACCVTRVLGRDIARSFGNGTARHPSSKTTATVKEVQLQLCLNLFEKPDEKKSTPAEQIIQKQETNSNISSTDGQDDLLPIEDEISSEPTSEPTNNIKRQKTESVLATTTEQFVSKSLYDSLEKKCADLLTENENLTADLNQMQCERNQIKRDYSELWRRHEALLRKSKRKRGKDAATWTEPF
eukprot:TRINITY_DN24476_c0_g1_i1.p1 TRINITY_DN24476_c0_g1~~TRINITY_DN24476_c0_g1_i1.p1  ORF type:complete len:749 (+),score=118.27 TRINITY_DN24476_c0_g1_i1:48-2294(+)